MTIATDRRTAIQTSALHSPQVSCRPKPMQRKDPANGSFRRVPRHWQNSPSASLRPRVGGTSRPSP
jgi:hypothetical protein